MTHVNSNSIRQTAICVATAIAISLPGVAMAGLLDKAKSRVQRTKANAVKVVSIVREKRPVAGVFQNAAGALPAADIFEMVKELELKKQLLNTIELIRQMQADYGYFSGGASGCEAECKVFRRDLKAVFDGFLSLVQEVPVLSSRTGLIENVQRVSNLIDYVPPRALYLMWQALEGQLEEIQAITEEIRQAISILPPLYGAPSIMADAATRGANTESHPVCAWVEADKPFVELVQARLEMFSWRLKSAVDLIPDVEVKAEGGGEGGIAVANVTAAAGMGLKPTDQIKIALKLLAWVPERANWAIKINLLRAKTICAVRS